MNKEYVKATDLKVFNFKSCIASNYLIIFLLYIILDFSHI